ncbi:MAG: hypothetical protein DLM70_03765 [Chloroflexi bacterium]|nr:MAG: hypothetical protein DLM70_03765 [Chloroflexota bacterium]
MGMESKRTKRGARTIESCGVRGRSMSCSIECRRNRKRGWPVARRQLYALPRGEDRSIKRDGCRVDETGETEES